MQELLKQWIFSLASGVKRAAGLIVTAGTLTALNLRVAARLPRRFFGWERRQLTAPLGTA